MNQIIQKERLAKPKWLKVPLPRGEKYNWIKKNRVDLGLATVCEEARCPNIGECWGTGTATFMLMGDTCTRGCRFCSVKTKRNPGALDRLEPRKLADTIVSMKLKYVVLTTVDRDDLEDQGANHIKECIAEIKRKQPELYVEILMPDFRGDTSLLDIVIDSNAEVLAHNVESTKSLTETVRDPRAGYEQSLDVLRYLKNSAAKTQYVKSSIMVGFGEEKSEVLETISDIKDTGCDFLTIGQYLQPNKFKLQVSEYVTPEQFKDYEEYGLKVGFDYVASGPLVRSSYKAAEHYFYSKIKSNTVSDQI